MDDIRFNRKCIALIPLFLFGIACAQTRTIDRLKKEIARENDPRKKAGYVFSLCDQYRSLHPDTLYTYLQMAATLAEKSADPNDKFRYVFYRTVYLINKALLDSADLVINRNLAALTGPAQKDLRNDFIMLKSRLLIKSNKQKESIDNSLQLLQASEAANDTMMQLRAKIFIGWAYMELEQNQKALNWFLEAVSLDDATKHRYSQPALYGNLTSIYVNLLKFDSAELWSVPAVRIAEQKEDLTGLANAYFINAGIYIETHENARAERLMEDGLKIRKEIGDPFYIVSDIYQLGNFYAHNHEPQKGIDVVHEGIKIAEQYKLRAKLILLYTALGENYLAAGDFKNYGSTLNTLIVLKDSMYTKNSAEALSDIQTKYEVQKKQNIIIGQQLDLARKNNLIFGIFILMAAAALIAFVAFRARRRSQQLKMRELVLEQKKKTMEAVMDAEENERKRIAADLHDSVAQKMVVAKLNLEVLHGDLPAMNEEQLHLYDNIFSLVDESCTEVRNLSHSMMPQAFFQSGLTDAVNNFIHKIENKNLRIVFDVRGDLKQLDKNTELMIYRVIQECLQNIIKHAEATKVDISVIYENDEIDVMIDDNGVGFDPESSEATGGMGMKNIRSRIDFLNGKLDINSTPGKGSVIAFYIPAKQS